MENLVILLTLHSSHFAHWTQMQTGILESYEWCNSGFSAGRTDEEEEEEEEGAMQPKLGKLSTSEVTKDSVHLSWTVQAGAFDSFLLQYRDVEGKRQALPVDGGSRTLVISDLLPSRKYKFNFYGISGHKRLGPISTNAVTAFPEASSVTPPRLEQLLVSEVTPTSLRLRWDTPEGDFDTFLVRFWAGGPPRRCRHPRPRNANALLLPAACTDRRV
ncbi:hypothetical protein KIL84_008444 [Mauremys mutica]|uniref:Fibronectin type-III domain-containing protein n=1 Tax=Mauremys mutica TaxID=74926 RepID=A0A9D3X7Q5_9SAUR|nr:hypothetical protein KIL84_008444 [Mauremys mutica]